MRIVAVCLVGWIILVFQYAAGQVDQPAAGRITKIVISDRHPAFGGASFGSAGPYEMVTGTAYCELDPKAALNSGIINLQYAPLNPRGRVEYSTAIAILKPVDINKGNGRLIYDVLNRGHEKALSDLNLSKFSRTGPQEVTDPATAFIMKRGYTVAWSGWQADGSAESTRPGLLKANFPVAMRDGKPITGASREEFTDVPAGPSFTELLTYPAARLDTSAATLTVREREEDPRKPLPASSWSYIDAKHVRIAAAPGFDRGALYELIYQATDAVVEGISLASIRDFVSFLRYADRDSAGQPNPVHPATPFKAVLGMGISQSGRVTKAVVSEGFNVDSSGRKVFDGVLSALSGSGSHEFNAAFAQPGRYSMQHEDRLYSSDQFPFTYATTTDPLTGCWRNARSPAPARRFSSSIRTPKSGRGAFRWSLPIPPASRCPSQTMSASICPRAFRTIPMTSASRLPAPQTAAFAGNCATRCITGITCGHCSWLWTAGLPMESSRLPAATRISKTAR